MHVYETRVRVRYAETDQMGVVYYANHFVWMEVGRLEYCKSAGFNYRDMEIDDGVFLAVVEAQCRYRHPARLPDKYHARFGNLTPAPPGQRSENRTQERPLARAGHRLTHAEPVHLGRQPGPRPGSRAAGPGRGLPLPQG